MAAEWGSAFNKPGPPARTRKAGPWGSAFDPPKPAVRKKVYRDAAGNVESVVEERDGAEPITRWVVRDEDGNIVAIEED